MSAAPTDTGLRREGCEVVMYTWVHTTARIYRRRKVLGAFSSEYWAGRFFDALHAGSPEPAYNADGLTKDPGRSDE